MRVDFKRVNWRWRAAPKCWRHLLEGLVADGKKEEAQQVYYSLLEKIDKSALPTDAKENMKKRANELIQKRRPWKTDSI